MKVMIGEMVVQHLMDTFKLLQIPVKLDAPKQGVSDKYSQYIPLCKYSLR